MAETETTVAMDDAELFSAATAPEPTQEAPAEEAPAEAEQPRDEQGRFAPKAKEPDAAPTQQQPVEQKASTEAPKPEDDAILPSWRAREIREARDAAERRATEEANQRFVLQQQLQRYERELADLKKPKQEPVDFFADPNAALKQQLDPLQSNFQSELQTLRRELSETRAIAKYGAAAYSAMEAELNAALASNDPELHALSLQVQNSRDPAAVTMKWYEQRKVMKEVGNDPASYRQKILDEALKDPAFQAKVIESARGQAQQPGSPVIKLPPSLNKVTGSGASPEANDGDDSQEAIFKYATAPRRR